MEHVLLAICLLHGVLIGVANADVPELYFDWTVSYKQIAPLGVNKQVILINDQFPGPLLNATTNDVVHVNVINNINESFLLTWNGVQQRKSSWEDGVGGTNCPIPVGQNWTYRFQVKDQIGSFFYYPSLLFQRAAGGYGPIRINNRVVIPIPFPLPRDDFDILVGDWYNADYKAMRASLDGGRPLSSDPDGILINGLGPGKASFTFQPGATYRLRISNVGVKASINFRIQGHKMLVVEAEGSYVVKENYTSLDIHVGQSLSVLVAADQPSTASYYIVASSRFLLRNLTGTAVLRYGSSNALPPSGPLPNGPDNYDYAFSYNQARNIRWDLSVGAARPNPQGSYHYGLINISRTIVLRTDVAAIGNRTRYTVNGISFVYPDTPLKLADYFKISGVFTPGSIPDKPDGRSAHLGTSVIDAHYRDFIQIVFVNKEPVVHSWHVHGYGFFVVGMDFGEWDDSKRSIYNLVDGVYRSTVQVYPNSWTAVMLSLDNMGMWSIRSMVEDKRYLGLEVYMRVKGDDEIPSVRDELPIPPNVLRCGRAAA